MPKTAGKYLREILAAQKKGRSLGIMSVCSANRFVLEAAMRQAIGDGTILCIESTAAQVNQFGGYTGMTPREFAAFVGRTAGEMNFPQDRILLGGDHLGPGPWQKEPAEEAMRKGCDLIREYVAAGYEKIHLDASMPCIDDNADGIPMLQAEVAVERSALLCEAAEAAASPLPDQSPVYVIGTDVPPPGGMSGAGHDLSVSEIEDVEYTIAATKKCFDLRNLEEAWERTVAVVVQTGADFGPDTVVDYDRHRAGKLTAFIEGISQFVYEAHSTDYQRQSALTEMVEDHFAVLKVGPALTFSLREALTALAAIEEEWLANRRGIQRSMLRQVVEETMRKDPVHWIKYHRGDDPHFRFAPYYSYSDRVRYYLNRPEIDASVKRLMANLSLDKIPLPLISQYLPKQYDLVREGRLCGDPKELIYSKIMEVTSRYSAACKPETGIASLLCEL